MNTEQAQRIIDAWVADSEAYRTKYGAAISPPDVVWQAERVLHPTTPSATPRLDAELERQRGE